MGLTSDPHAWLRPIFAQLHANPTFRQFAPSHQFAQLVEAVALDHPAKAKSMREWSVGAQMGLLLHLASMIDQKEVAKFVELWRLQKGRRELRCEAYYLPSGIDIRLMEGDGFRRTRLVRDAVESKAISDQWRAALMDRGWNVVAIINA